MNIKRKADNYNWRSNNSTGNNNILKLDDDNTTQPCKRTEIIRDGRKFPVFQKPLVIGVFSIDSKRKFHLDLRQLKYLFCSKFPQDALNNMKVNFNLNAGINNCIRKDETVNEKLDQIFQWILAEGRKKEELQVIIVVGPSKLGKVVVELC